MDEHANDDLGPGSALMRALILQFAAGDPPQLLGSHVSHRGVIWDVVRMDLPHTALSLEGYDVLIGLGGPMSVNDAAQYPFLGEAMELIRQAVAQALPYLGICLGGQLLAAACGGQVRRAEAPEIGVIEVALRDDAADPLLRGLEPVIVTTQFHEDTYDLPAGGLLLATSAHCQTQMARCGARAYALQFHPEVSPDTFADWLEVGYAHATGDPDPASRAAVLAGVRAHEAEIRRHAAMLFDNFIDLAAHVPA